ncbi:MAG: CocE/NonD family hydrolase, partial [Phycisphaerae bacterium]|nr:CocE/NonD family hydrolase [Phycisphaerae bacterium]
MRLKELLKLNRSDEKGILNLGDRGLMRQVAAATSPGVTIEQESRRAEMKLRRRGVLLLLPILGVLAGVGNAGVAAAAPRRYKVGIKRDVRVPMRDGVNLATDIYYPMENGRRLKGKLPAVLLRTPYNKSKWGPRFVRFFAEHGYLSVTQDCRGRYKSE